MIAIDGSNNLMLCIIYSYVERLHNNIHSACLLVANLSSILRVTSTICSGSLTQIKRF